MTIPIVTVHGIGKLNVSEKKALAALGSAFKDETYCKDWVKHFPEARFYNATWHPYGFNLTYAKNTKPLGLRSLSALHGTDLPFMVKLAEIGKAKVKALDTYIPHYPWYKRAWSSTVNAFSFKILGTDTLDFIGDVIVYLDWQNYTELDENPIKQAVRLEIEQALEDNPNTPINIAAHSLGSKIVWDVLQEMGIAKNRINLLMTISCPLQPMKILGFYNEGDVVNFKKPECVKHWLNVYDVRDPIGAPIASPDFDVKGGTYMTYKEVMQSDTLYECANVCTDIGIFPWTAHTHAWKTKAPRALFEKYTT